MERWFAREVELLKQGDGHVFHGEGSSVVQERTHAFAMKSSLCRLCPGRRAIVLAPRAGFCGAALLTFH
jgi:hypothetical protein